jgi:hypothetical protein
MVTLFSKVEKTVVGKTGFLCANPVARTCGSKACSRCRLLGFLGDCVIFIAGKPCSHKGMVVVSYSTRRGNHSEIAGM